MYFLKNLTRRSIESSVHRYASIFALLMILLFAGCDDGTSSTNDPELGTLNGIWKDSYENTITIDTTAKTIVAEDSYEATIEDGSSDFSATDGVLIIKFSKFCDFMNPPPLTSHANVGKYGAIYWTDLTATTVKMADAYTVDWSNHEVFDDLDSAKEAFTPVADKVGNYVSGWSHISPYTKQ